MMRLTTLFLTVLFTLLCGAVASASVVTMTSSYAGQALQVGDTVDVTLTFDADETGIELMSVGVFFEDADVVYVPRTNASLGIPTYILYGMVGMSSSALYPQQPIWGLWPGTKPPGKGQVNVNWADPSFTGTLVTGTGFLLADLRFEVISVANTTSDLDLTVTAGGNIFQVNADPNAVLNLSGTPITLNLPEPTGGALSLAALLSIGVLRYRARRS